MNLSRKIIFGSIAGVLALSPVLPVVLNSSSTVEAAETTSLKLNHNAYTYNAQGKRIYYNGMKKLWMGTTVNGIGKTTTINGKNYYPLAGGAYVKAANIGTVGNQVQAGNLELNYNTFVYDRTGRRLAKFRGSKKNTHLLKGTPLKYSGTVEKTDRNSKQYFLLNDDNYSQSWLPYVKIGNKYYYSIGGGGYINAANVGQIDNKPLYTAEATVTIKDDQNTSPVSVGVGKEKTVVNRGQKIRVDRVNIHWADPNNYAVYRISGTKTDFFAQSMVKKQPRQKLLTYTQNTYVQITSDTNTYDMNGEIRSNQVPANNASTPFVKNDKIPVDELLYIWSSKDNKAELYYHLARNNNMISTVFKDNNKDNLTFIKAANGKYISGPKLDPINTAEEAKADSKVATVTDKQELQKLIAQENTVKANANYKQFRQPRYESALATAKVVNDSSTASLAVVKQITRVLNFEQKQALLSVEETEFYDKLADTMPE